MSSITALRARVESSLAGRIAAPFAYRDRRVADTVSCGIPEIDALTGGLPRGALTEICGMPCSGRTSLLLAALATRTAEAECCALVDGRDSFDPESAQAAGVQLDRLLWVRCRDIEQSLRATDLLVRAEGFGLIAVDLADIEPKTVRGVTLNTWFRFRRAVEDTPSILLLIEQESNAKTCASLVLRLEAEKARWIPECRPPGHEAEIKSTRSDLSNNGESGAKAPILVSPVHRTEVRCSHQKAECKTWTRLLCGYSVRAERLHARVQAAKEIVFGAAPKKTDGTSKNSASFESRTEWIRSA